MLVELTPDSAIELLDLSLTKDGNETGDAMRRRIARVKLLRGRIFVSQERRDLATVPTLMIDTANGAASSNFDAVFALENDSAMTRMTCASGWAYFAAKAPGDATRVEPGYVLQVPNDAQPKPFAAETDAASQKTIADATAAAKMLIRLRDSLKDATPPWKVADGR